MKSGKQGISRPRLKKESWSWILIS